MSAPNERDLIDEAVGELVLDLQCSEERHPEAARR